MACHAMPCHGFWGAGNGPIGSVSKFHAECRSCYVRSTHGDLFLTYTNICHFYKLLATTSSPAGAFFPPEKHDFSIISQGLVPGGPLWDTLGHPWAPFGPPWGPLWLLLESPCKLDVQGGPRADFLIDVCSGMAGLEFIRGSPGSRGSRGSPGNGGKTAARSLPSPRLLARMTAVTHKLPQTMLQYCKTA